MTETVGNREDGAESAARAVLVGAGEPRDMEELGRLATALGVEGGGGREAGRGRSRLPGRDGGGRGGRGTWRSSGVWRRRLGWRSPGSSSRAVGTTPATWG